MVHIHIHTVFGWVKEVNIVTNSLCCSLVGRFVSVLGATLHVTGPAHPFTWVDVIIAVIPSHSMIAARGICPCAGSSTVQYSTVQYSTSVPVQGPAQINIVHCLALQSPSVTTLITMLMFNSIYIHNWCSSCVLVSILSVSIYLCISPLVISPL